MNLSLHTYKMINNCIYQTQINLEVEPKATFFTLLHCFKTKTLIDNDMFDLLLFLP